MSYVNPFQNVPSASKLHRVLECPGSHQAEFAAPSVEEDTTEANIGNEVHAILAGELTEDTASVEAVQTAEMCECQVSSLITEWGHDAGNMLSEKRYGLTRLGGVVEVTESTKADVIFTGQFDRLYISGTHGLLIDFKSLRGDHATAIENPQLMSLAVLVAKKHKLTDVRVALVQPMKGKPTTADFNANGLKLAESWLFAALDAEMEAGPDDLRAGDWCKYCKARYGCRKFQEAAIQEVEVIEPATIAGMDGETQRKAMWARVSDLPDARLAAAMNGLAMVKYYVAAIEGVAKVRAKNDLGFQQFFTLREKKGRRSITDVTKVFAACEAHGVTAEQFTALCSIGLGDVKQLLKDATHSKGKALDNLHDAVLTGAVEVGKSSVELVPAGQLE
jgi:hypothetical protein